MYFHQSTLRWARSAALHPPAAATRPAADIMLLDQHVGIGAQPIPA